MHPANMTVISVKDAMKKVATLENGLEDTSEKAVQTENTTLVFLIDDSSKVCGDAQNS